jgi:hypothetical protein
MTWQQPLPRLREQESRTAPAVRRAFRLACGFDTEERYAAVDHGRPTVHTRLGENTPQMGRRRPPANVQVDITTYLKLTIAYPQHLPDLPDTASPTHHSARIDSPPSGYTRKFATELPCHRGGDTTTHENGTRVAEIYKATGGVHSGPKWPKSVPKFISPHGVPGAPLPKPSSPLDA